MEIPENGAQRPVGEMGHHPLQNGIRLQGGPGGIAAPGGEALRLLRGETEDGDVSESEGASKPAKKAGYLYTENILDLDELAKEDATRSFEGVLFHVELVDEDGKALDVATATQLRSEADGLLMKRQAAVVVQPNASGEIDRDAKDGEDKPEVQPEHEGRVIYETNGNCAPYRVTLFAATDDDEEGEELMTVNVSRSGKVTIGDDAEEKDGKRR